MSSDSLLPPGLLLQKTVPPPEFPRRILRIVRVAAIFFLILSGLPLMYFYSFLKAVRFISNAQAAHLRTCGTAFWLRGILRAMGVRVHLQGKIPKGAALIIPNHQSYLDILVLLSQAPAVFVSNSGVRKWPVFGHLTAHLGTIYINRERRRMVKRVMPVVEEHLHWGVKVVVFLETTTTDGTGLLPFKPGFLEAAINTDTPCLPISIRYATPCDSLPTAATVNWWGGMKFFPHLWRMLALRKIRAQIRVAEAVEISPELSRKDLSGRIHSQISESLLDPSLCVMD